MGDEDGGFACFQLSRDLCNFSVTHVVHHLLTDKDDDDDDNDGDNDDDDDDNDDDGDLELYKLGS